MPYVFRDGKKGVPVLRYRVRYICFCHKGNCRSENQDNFICEDQYMPEGGPPPAFPLEGCIQTEHPALLGVFDGMGGEERGEAAAFLAAQCAAQTEIGPDPVADLLRLCRDANGRICAYAAAQEVTMGTTAALLAFSGKEIALCNIGDSKIFRFARRKLEQISLDHYGIAAHGLKPPLSQNLGIPESETVIAPHVAKGKYRQGDIYLLCSDGLTDMVPAGRIAQILTETQLELAAGTLLREALDRGGRDNITVILCRIEREKRSLFGVWPLPGRQRKGGAPIGC